MLDSVIPLLLHRATNEKQFIRDLARTALDSALATKEYESFASVLLTYSATEKNAQAVSVVRSGLRLLVITVGLLTMRDVIVRLASTRNGVYCRWRTRAFACLWTTSTQRSCKR